MNVHKKLYVTRVGDNDFYVSSIQDTEPDLFYIGMPMSQGRSLVLTRGESIEIRFTSEDASYCFESRVARVRDEGIALYGLTWPESAERKQLRRYVRISCLMDVSFAEQPHGKKPPVWHHGRAVDISAGGLRLQTNQSFSEGTLLLVKFTLALRNDSLDVQTQARVVRRQTIDETGSAGKIVYRYGLEFLDLPARRQDEIMAHIFWKMTESRRAT